MLVVGAMAHSLGLNDIPPYGGCSATAINICCGAAGNFNAAGQLGAASIGFNNDDMAVRLQQQTMQMQQVCTCGRYALVPLLSTWVYEPPACLQSAPVGVFRGGLLLQSVPPVCVFVYGNFADGLVFGAANAAAVPAADADDYAAADAGPASLAAGAASCSSGTSTAVSRAGRSRHDMCLSGSAAKV